MGSFDERIFAERVLKLNKAQRDAVETIDGPVLVIAGPGSGKTEILSLRIANILKKTDIYPAQVLAVTFTDAAAVNMRKRLEKIIGPDAYRVSIYTFHSFALSIIERYPEYFYGGAAFLPADEAYQVEVLESLFTSLDHANPLRSTHPEQGFVFMKDVRDAISALKKAGLTPEEFRTILGENKKELEVLSDSVDRIFSQRVSMGAVSDIEALIGDLKKMKVSSADLPGSFPPLSISLARSLSLVLEEMKETGKAAPLSLWKRNHIRTSGGKKVLKEGEYQEKMEALADIYEGYLTRMRSEGYFDFDDMILDAVHAIEENEGLRAELEEQFQYILVDEFQDTNDGQMRLLNLLTSSPVHEGRPNIMAVGDDDQAIYRFQGAEVSNILNFTEMYKDVRVITMTDNYRSHQSVLDIARHVILQGEERLEALLPGIEKELRAARGDLKEGIIEHSVYPTREHEFHAVSKQIRERLDAGQIPEEIAVIARGHKDLTDLLPYLHEEGIPIHYERAGNVLEEKHIRELIQMARFVGSIARRDKEEADYLLPEILAYPFWNIPRGEIWQISLEADRQAHAADENMLWVEVMKKDDRKAVSDIAGFFIRLAEESLHAPLEYILDDLVGAHVIPGPDTPEAEDDSRVSKERARSGEFESPYKEYYFSRARFEEDRAEYLNFLSNLETFIDAIRQYRRGKILSIEDLTEFVEIHEKNNIPVTNTRVFSNSVSAVRLMTAHKAKGLEFESVFVISALEDVWAKSRSGNNLPFPMNMPITPAGDTRDDQLRLFYVALTRAKHDLSISSHRAVSRGKEVLPVSFLAGFREAEEGEAADDIEVLEPLTPRYHTPPFTGSERGMLAPLVEDYQLSVTHFNNFLDVIHGGPQTFLEQNLLRFPQPKSISGIFGTLVHQSIEYVYRFQVQNKALPRMGEVMEYFQSELSKIRIDKDEKARIAAHGEAIISAFIHAKKDFFSPKHIVEANFREQGVIVEGVHLSGKIDTMIPNGKDMVVVDYKTGAPIEKWTASSDKAWRYKNQLIFYKLLVEHSRDWGKDFTVRKGILSFVEPVKDGSIIDLSLEIEEGDVERVRKLIAKVGAHIKNLDFPDVSDYPQTVKGIREFEDFLLNG